MSDSNETETPNFKAIEESQIPKLGENAKEDLFVRLPKSDRFIKYILRGETWDKRKQEMLKKHVDQRLYRKIENLDQHSEANPSKTKKVISADPIELNNEKLIIKGDAPLSKELRQEAKFLTDAEPISKSDVEDLNEIVAKELKELFRFMADPSIEDPTTTLESLAKVSGIILEKVAPEVENLRDVLLKNSKYLLVMNDAAAITSISVFIAMSHGFSSRKVFHDLSMAALLMDSPLSEFQDKDVKQYYKDRTGLDPIVYRKLKLHPKAAHINVRDRMKSISENILQLILSHHELYNGDGYPHGIRSESLSTLSRSLAMSVDIFEIMKREQLNGNEIELLDALHELSEPDAEAHRRRHHRRLVSDSINYITKPTEASAAQ